MPKPGVRFGRHELSYFVLSNIATLQHPTRYSRWKYMHSCYSIEPPTDPPPTLVTLNPVRGACIRTSLPPTLRRDATVTSFGVNVTRRPRSRCVGYISTSVLSLKPRGSFSTTPPLGSANSKLMISFTASGPLRLTGAGPADLAALKVARKRPIHAYTLGNCFSETTLAWSLSARQARLLP